jgi:hypothetical protein
MISLEALPLMIIFLMVLPANYQLPRINTKKKNNTESKKYKMTAENPFWKSLPHLAQVCKRGTLFIIGSESMGNSSAAISKERMTPYMR